MDYDFPIIFSWEWNFIPTDEAHDFSEGYVYHQPEILGIFGVCFEYVPERILGNPYQTRDSSWTYYQCWELRQNVRRKR